MRMNEYRKTKLIIFIISTIFIMIALLLSCWFLIFCRIKTVEVTGNERTKTELILSTIDIKTNSHIYSINEKELEKTIIESNPNVSEVEIRKKLPSTIRIIIKENTPTFYAYNKKSYYVLSEELRILQISKNKNDIDGKNYIELVLPEFSQNNVGEYISYTDVNVENATKKVINTLTKSELINDITSLSIESRFDISALYKGKYTIVFLDYVNMDKKVSNCISALEYLDKKTDISGGTLYAISATEVSFEKDI